ncbi:phosphatase PAP2 family protein [Streptomyces tsukubensis]|uniref:Phosphatidic acid phosphatase type 2/haloperoxidase domain-containing protein n=1 Tax=Streptomyces tsukubensis TaxID=83656 RepID=A0A1V3ZZA5_9ACTN|nr:phosphatase PAP2 family protein [Streptomyces tsukubensis]OON71792.1 hypothetical protein B1H18_32465 [Streptomyces tsukubensis]QFR97020.1 phosphatase PAP2 family protein [Streptomyces tsukubensis]
MQPAPLHSSTSPPRPGRLTPAASLLAAASVVLLVLVAAGWSAIEDFDASVSRPVHRWAVEHSGLTRAFRVLSDWVWDPWTMRALAVVVALWLLRRGERRTALWFAGACVGGSVVQQVVKSAVGRERPRWPDPVDSAHFAAYPSGHALTATVVLGLVLWLMSLYGAGSALWRTALVVAAVSVPGVGLTRIWLGVHWPTDVLGGWLLGGLIVLLTVLGHGRDPRGTPS